MKRPTDTEGEAGIRPINGVALETRAAIFCNRTGYGAEPYYRGWRDAEQFHLSAQTAEINRLKAERMELVEALEEITQFTIHKHDEQLKRKPPVFRDWRDIARAALEKVRKAGGANE